MCKTGYHTELTYEEGSTAEYLVQYNTVQLVYDLVLQQWHPDNGILFPKEFWQAALCFALWNDSIQNSRITLTNTAELDILQTVKQLQSERINATVRYVVFYESIVKV